MKGNVEHLLEEFVGRWTRDEPLAVDDLLVRAGPEADELAGLIDRFLERAPRREPTPDALAFVRSLDDPPLLRARQALGLKLDDLAAALVEQLGVGETARLKVRRYYQELELGQLRPGGVAASVWEALSGVLGRDACRLAALPPAAPMAAPMYRKADFAADVGVDAAVAAPSAAPERDEIDRLFGVTPGVANPGESPRNA